MLEQMENDTFTRLDNVKITLTDLLEFCEQPANNIEDVRQLLNELIEELI